MIEATFTLLQIDFNLLIFIFNPSLVISSKNIGECCYPYITVIHKCYAVSSMISIFGQRKKERRKQ